MVWSNLFDQVFLAYEKSVEQDIFVGSAAEEF